MGYCAISRMEYGCGSGRQEMFASSTTGSMGPYFSWY